MNFKLNKILGVSILAAGSLFLSACGESAIETPVTDTAETQQQSEVPATTGDYAVETEGLSGTLRIASFTNESYVWATAFAGANPDVDVQVSITTMEGGLYQEWLMPLLALGGDIPDVIFLEAEFIRQFVETDFVRDLSHLVPYAESIGAFPFTIDAGTYNGQARAFSFQATPGVMYFRRSMAERYLGTSDPAEVQEFFRDRESMLEAGHLINEGSDGNSFLVAGANEFFRGFTANRQYPWVVDNTLTVDPLMMDFIEFSRYLTDHGMQAQISAWSAEWFQGMDDNLVDAFGTPIQIFAYLLPTWGLPYVIMGNAETTAGDWGVIESPFPYHWGGTWMAVTRDARSPELAEAFIKFATMNADNLEKWATGYFTNEFLTSIDPTIPEGISRAPGDFVSSQQVVDSIADTFATGPVPDFLGGQNPYEMFGRLAPNVSLRLMQGTDAAIGDRWQDAVGAYLEGELNSVEEILQSFRNDISIILPDLNLQ